ncbi:unnamed protein product, partial [marine sediment metagenome]
EIWKVGESRNITWNKAGSIANVKIEYSTDGGTTFPNEIIDTTDAGVGSYTWNPIPDAIGNQLRVRITDVLDATVKDISDNNFEIKGTVTVTAPNGTEAWEVGSSENITWTKQGALVTSVKLEYSLDDFATAGIEIATGVDAATGTPYPWTIPDALSNT